MVQPGHNKGQSSEKMNKQTEARYIHLRYPPPPPPLPPPPPPPHPHLHLLCHHFPHSPRLDPHHGVSGPVLRLHSLHASRYHPSLLLLLGLGYMYRVVV
ncbi:hypothetical protein BC936DRAFT_140684 [Jimgerdemannia flammicorona]|uniref:Uncharacterized protein n=1 Tax=Jimgerdemannia flammicorona TaxID=994334 RepID=A0A433AEM6_9FUNG|nr:hypothetical protein BC936DRAFT_140684 [Jimgerdemannia flammicorona]